MKRIIELAFLVLLLPALCQGEENTQPRVGEHNAVVWKFEYRKPRSANRSSVGVSISPPYGDS